MSRIGKLPVNVPGNVKIEVNADVVKAEGPKGKLSVNRIEGLDVTFENQVIHVSYPAGVTPDNTAKQGLLRALLANLVTGVSEGFTKKMEVIGVGYRVQMKGSALDLTIGKSHPVLFDVPEGVEVTVSDTTHFQVSGIDKQKVGQVAASIRALYPPEPYKGKGIRYENERVHRKAGKSAA